MELKEIGGRIKAERKNLHISQEKLAELVNVSPHYIYEIERGMKAMSLETLINLSEALKLPTDYILFGEKDNERRSIYDKLSSMSEERRARAEEAFEALLPYIK